MYDNVIHTHFNDRFMGSINCVLVYAAMADYIQKELPTTPYLKCFDVWLMWYLSSLFVICVYHIVFDRFYKGGEDVEQKSGTKRMKNINRVCPTKINHNHPSAEPMNKSLSQMNIDKKGKNAAMNYNRDAKLHYIDKICLLLLLLITSIFNLVYFLLTI